MSRKSAQRYPSYPFLLKGYLGNEFRFFRFMKTSNSLGEKVRQAIRLDRAVRFLWQAVPGWTIKTSLALVFLQGVLPLLALYVMKLIVDAVTFVDTGLN